LGNLSYIADMQGNSINFDRDLSGNIIFVKDKAGNQTFMTRDPSGNLESSRDPLGYTTSYDYDQMNRLTKITDPIGGQTLFTYLPTGQLETITDANNHTTSYFYNEQYRVERASNHLGQEVLYTHDKDGNILTKTTKAGDNISYAYDGLSKLLSKSFTGDSAQYVYDKDSLLISMSDNDSVVQRSYDRFGRLESEVASHHNAVTSWGYNVLAENTETQVNLGNQGLINIQRLFDQNGNLFSLKARILGQTVNYQKVRNDLNDVTQRTLPNGALTQINYDANSRMVDMTTSALGGNYMDYRYTANGNISTVFESLNQSAKPYIYEYDSLGRLIKEQTIKNKTYTYDAVGNDTSNGGQYNELNQLIEDNDSLFTYDLNGNQTSKTAKLGGARQEFFWNAESQMIQAKVFKTTNTLQYTINYKYDASGRRIERDVVNHLVPAKSYTHKFIYDKEHIVAILDASNQVLAAFVFDEGIDEPVAMVTDYNQDGKMNVLTYVRDRQNSVKMIANEKKEIIQEVYYSAYGETQIVNAGIEKTKLINPFYYTSRELEPELGIYYYRARYYDPSTGRFISEDPIGFAGGDYNLYRYVGNNPVKDIDPLGKTIMSASDRLGGTSPVQGHSDYTNPGPTTDSPLEGAEYELAKLAFEATLKALLDPTYTQKPYDPNSKLIVPPKETKSCLGGR
ncbi:MAG: RHS repeat-associated core domain-containing protein, partial [Bacteriovoracaceae bacterium]|nr:RHS repeat-associated core domain-containing protein [Bacteriovoracaceae bacterium]